MTCLLHHFVHLKPVAAGVAAFIGYVNIAGQLTTHTRSYSVSGESQVMPTTAQIANQNILLGSIQGTEIIATGAFSSTANLIIAGPARQIHTGATAAEHQFGGGTVTIVDPFVIGINGITNILVDANTTTKWGTDWTKRHGWFYGTGSGNAQLQNRGVIEIRSASYKDTDPQNGGNLQAGAVIRFIGDPDSPKFYDNTSWIPNTGRIEVTDAVVRRRGTNGTGTVSIAEGASWVNGVPGISAATQQWEIAGNGTGLPGYPQAALAWEYSNNFYMGGITLTDDATIAYAAPRDAGTAYNYFPPITSAADKVLTIGCPPIGTGNSFTNYGDTASLRIGAAHPNLLGPVVVAYGDLFFDVANAMVNAQSVTLGEFSHITMASAQSFKSLSAPFGRELWLGSTLTLTAQDPTPVKNNFAGTGSVIVSAGQLNFDRATISTTGTFNASGTSKIGTVQATTALSGPLTIGATATLKVNNVGGAASKLTCTTANLTAGWKVDVAAGIAPGTYTILTKTAGTATAPTLGVNDSGLTATLAWVGNNLQLTLA